MSVTESVSSRRLDIGQALQDVFSVLSRNLGPLALLGVLLAGVPLSLVYVGAYLTVQNWGFSLLAFAGFVADMIGRAILFGAVVFLTVRDLDGEPATVRDSLVAGRRRWGSLLGLMIVNGLGIGIGLVLLIVPGIYFALKWAVAGPDMVLSGRGISDSRDRSSALTRGRRWATLLLFAIIYAVIVVLAVLLGLVGDGLKSIIPKVLIAAVLDPLSNVCTEVMLAIVAAVLYRRLRGDAEGAPTAVLAEVFA